MSRRLSLGALGVLASLGLVPASARAAAAEDFIRAQDVFINSASVLVAGKEYTTTGFRIPKVANSLDITITGADVGLPFSQSIELHGVRSGNLLSWTFDKTFNPPLELGGTQEVHRASGTLFFTANLLAGRQSPRCNDLACPRNVLLSQTPNSWIRVEGEGALGVGFSHLITVPRFRALGGLGQPGLAQLSIPDTAPICSGPVDTFFPMSAFLTGWAPAGGTKVDFTSTHPQYLKVPPNVFVKAGQSFASVKARVKAGFTGQVGVSASSAGVVVSRQVRISPQADCASGGRVRTVPLNVKAYVPDLLLGCINCTELIDIGMRDTGLVRVSRVDSYFNGSQLRPLASVFDVASVNAIDMTDSGLVTGTLVPQTGSAPVAFKASLEGGPSAPVLLGAFTPTRIASNGVVFGHRSTRTGNIAVYHDGNSLKDLPIPGASASQVTAVSDAGHVAGTYERSGDVRAFLFTDGTLRTLPQLARTTTTVPVAVNIRGQVVAHSVDATGDVLATALIDSDDTIHVLAVPSGFDRLHATSINARGWVVATATSSTGSSGFLYTPEDGLVDLNRIIQPAAGVVVTDAVSITEADRVLVNATAHGNRSLYLLTLP
ncbi:hypothetical protein OV208_30280 [Corallococcus sp. bb12-1]|uniref:hypothetical protein n=1 Tax=Corallococcus sp. bb12-1 TaxID=2996784 RepID=UPI0022714BF3|nr:hypothetical protein [Corallococcus sp. bb12-1]MCY1045642.1 hypothetical protein [Corallococcus sp. bb12-1]